jgi:hypothetical protein
MQETDAKAPCSAAFRCSYGISRNLQSSSTQSSNVAIVGFRQALGRARLRRA